MRSEKNEKYIGLFVSFMLCGLYIIIQILYVKEKKSGLYIITYMFSLQLGNQDKHTSKCLILVGEQMCAYFPLCV